MPWPPLPLCPCDPPLSHFSPAVTAFLPSPRLARPVLVSGWRPSFCLDCSSFFSHHSGVNSGVRSSERPPLTTLSYYTGWNILLLPAAHLSRPELARLIHFLPPIHWKPQEARDSVLSWYPERCLAHSRRSVGICGLSCSLPDQMGQLPGPLEGAVAQEAVGLLGCAWMRPPVHECCAPDPSGHQQGRAESSGAESVPLLQGHTSASGFSSHALIWLTGKTRPASKS